MSATTALSAVTSPRGKSLRKVTQVLCNQIADDINDMPRKILDYATARERFEEELAKLIT